MLVENCPVLQLELVSAPLPLLASPDSQQNWAMSGWSLEAADLRLLDVHCAHVRSQLRRGGFDLPSLSNQCNGLQ